MTAIPYTLSNAINAGATYCSLAPGGFARWTDPRNPGQFAWFCPECDCEQGADDYGCPHCGYYRDDDDLDEAA